MTMQRLDHCLSFDQSKELGRGVKSTVFHGMYGEMEVAVKRINCVDKLDAEKTKNDINKIYREKDIMHKIEPLRHPNIVGFYYSAVSDKHLYLALELCQYTLKDYAEDIQMQDNYPPLKVNISMANGLQYLHSQNVVHRDLKPENVFLVARAKLIQKVVLGDFGTSKCTLEDMFSFTGSSGTIGYIPLEFCEAMDKLTKKESLNSKLSIKSDIFALGCLFYYTCTAGGHPFGSLFQRQNNISSASLPSLEHIADCMEPCKELLKKMLSHNPKERPNAIEIVTHPSLWMPEKIVSFFKYSSDTANKMYSNNPVSIGLLEVTNVIPNQDWINLLPFNLKQVIIDRGKLYRGKGSSVVGLLRAIRNVETHYSEYSEDVQTELGSFPDGHAQFWTKLCPKLLMHVHRFVTENVTSIPEEYQGASQTSAPCVEQNESDDSKLQQEEETTEHEDEDEAPEVKQNESNETQSEFSIQQEEETVESKDEDKAGQTERSLVDLPELLREKLKDQPEQEKKQYAQLYWQQIEPEKQKLQQEQLMYQRQQEQFYHMASTNNARSQQTIGQQQIPVQGMSSQHYKQQSPNQNQPTSQAPNQAPPGGDSLTNWLNNAPHLSGSLQQHSLSQASENLIPAFGAFSTINSYQSENHGSMTSHGSGESRSLTSSEGDYSSSKAGCSTGHNESVDEPRSSLAGQAQFDSRMMEQAQVRGLQPQMYDSRMLEQMRMPHPGYQQPPFRQYQQVPNGNQAPPSEYSTKQTIMSDFMTARQFEHRASPTDTELRDPRDPRDPRDLRYLREKRDTRDPIDKRDMRDARDARDQRPRAQELGPSQNPKGYPVDQRMGYQMSGPGGMMYIAPGQPQQPSSSSMASPRDDKSGSPWMMPGRPNMGAPSLGGYVDPALQYQAQVAGRTSIKQGTGRQSVIMDPRNEDRYGPVPGSSSAHHSPMIGQQENYMQMSYEREREREKRERSEKERQARIATEWERDQHDDSSSLIDYLKDRFYILNDSSDESMANEDSEDAHSRADSKTDSRTDLQLKNKTITLDVRQASASKHSVSSKNDTEPWRSSVEGTPPTLPKSPSQKIHKFQFKNFNMPLKCNYCTSLLIGVHRQGIMCAECGYTCHIHCSDKAPSVCPVPPDQTKGPMRIDVNKGIGTASEGFVRVPRIGGIKKGWARLFVVVCDFKLFLYDIPPDRGCPSPVVQQVLDMRDDEFSVSPVLRSDVIDASKKDIPCIFRVTTSELSLPGTKHSVLMLAENETERQRWVGTLNVLQKLLRKNKLQNRTLFQAQEVYDSSLSLVKGTFSASILESNRLLLGTEEGLYIAELAKDVLIRIGDKSEKKPVFQVELVPEEQLIVFISGKQRHIMLLHTAALEGYDIDPFKIQETKSCHMFCTNAGHVANTNTFLCVAIKRTIQAFQLTKSRQKYRKVIDIIVPNQVQFLEMWGERLCVGYQSCFAIYNVLGEGAPVSIVNTEDSALQYLVHTPVDSMLAVELSEKEYLLAFSVCGVYVDMNGRKSRPCEIMWPAAPTSVSYYNPYLICYTENSVFIYDANTAEWVQTLCLKKTKPLSRDGSLNLINNFDAIHLIYFKNMQSDEDKLSIAELLKGRSVNRNKKGFSFQETRR